LHDALPLLVKNLRGLRLLVKFLRLGETLLRQFAGTSGIL